ncbi:MAG: glycosyltransferase [candidate division WOR-3 bacterium]
MKKLLVLSYYFPPCARSGVQRALRLAKYLPQHGWEPVFLAPKKAYCRGREDPALLKEIGPARVYRVPDPMPFKESVNLIGRAARRAWNALVAPDAHWPWASRAAELGIRLARDEGFSGVFATGYPFSSFVAGEKISSAARVPLILDYRDPWTGNPAFKQNPNLEAKLIGLATGVFCATESQAEHISSIFGHREKIKVFPYSYEPRPWVPAPENLVIGFGGTHYGNLTPFRTFLLGLKDTGWEFISHGALDRELVRLAEKLGISQRVKFYGFLPREEYFRFLESCRAILVADGFPDEMEKRLIPGKFLDALSVGRPVLYLGLEGLLWRIIQENRVGFPVRWDDPEGVVKALSELANWGGGPVSVPHLEATMVMRDFVKDIEAWL